MSGEILIRVFLIIAVLVFVLYQFGYRDKFPYIGQHLWTERPFYSEIETILHRQVSKYALGAELPASSKARLKSTVDMVLTAFNKDYACVQVNLPNLDVGVQSINFTYEITRSEVLNIVLDE